MKFKTKKSILKLYLLLAIVASFVLSVWRILLLKEHCNPYDMSFQDGALPELELFEYVLLAIVAVLSTCIFFVRKTKFGLFGACEDTVFVIGGNDKDRLRIEIRLCTKVFSHISSFSAAIFVALYLFLLITVPCS